MDLEVARGDLARVRALDDPPPALPAGAARCRVDGFALSANNVSYAAFGDVLGYWDVFPASPPDAGDDTVWGRIPVWGFATVVESDCPDVAVGERLYGYLPMSTSVDLLPGRADPRSIVDTAPHRAALASAYNRYVRVAADPIHREGRDEHQMLLYPLFFTSFLIDDVLGDRPEVDAEQVVISSASSKTSLGVAHLARRRGQRVVGLTSAANAGFVEGLGVVDEVVVYGAEAAIAEVSSVFVDVAGNADVRAAVHTRLGAHLRSSMIVGGTHWDHQPEAVGADLPGPTPEFFFAPAQIAKRSSEWGAAELDRRVGAAWDSYLEWVDTWLDLRRAVGADAVTAVYLDLLAGRVDPRVGHLCSLATTQEEPS